MYLFVLLKLHVYQEKTIKRTATPVSVMHQGNRVFVPEKFVSMWVWQKRDKKEILMSNVSKLEKKVTN